MENTRDNIYFQFSYLALKLLGKNLYSDQWAAISELVANGLDAKAEKVRVYFNLVDKSNAAIEIIDDGSGMSYNDLVSKYVWIGKNKRDDILDEDLKKIIMGRKGIGKLAALYLSNKFYIATKTNDDESAWVLDFTNIKDSDMPALKRVQFADLCVENLEIFQNLNTGTIIKLTNVDLTRVGVQKIEGFKASLSDYYLLDALKGKIEVAARFLKTDKIEFQNVCKEIAFGNFYAMFCSESHQDTFMRMQKSLFIPSLKYEVLSKKPRETIAIKEEDLKLKLNDARLFGKSAKGDGTELKYSLNGWIGIHATIRSKEAQINDENYLKNSVYRPNSLRLYVRNKLAIENFLKFLDLTGAFANYLEGEISFDILDSDDLEDIATSNRQSFLLEDERIQLLIGLVRPICRALITARQKMGEVISNEEKAISSEREQRLIDKEREARLLVEIERQQKLYVQQLAREKEIQLGLAKIEIETRKQQNQANIKKIDKNVEYLEDGHHLIAKAASNATVDLEIITMKCKKDETLLRLTDNAIYSVKRIKEISELAVYGNYDFKSRNVADLVSFLKDLSERHPMSEYINVRVQSSKPKIFVNFHPADIAMIFENIIDNSYKAHAKNLEIKIDIDKENFCIEFGDDGDGLAKDVQDPNAIFELSYSKTNGTGIGLAHVFRVVQENDGEVEYVSKEKGFNLRMRMKYESSV